MYGAEIPSGRTLELGLNLSASLLGVFSVCMKSVRRGTRRLLLEDMLSADLEF